MSPPRRLAVWLLGVAVLGGGGIREAWAQQPAPPVAESPAAEVAISTSDAPSSSAPRATAGAVPGIGRQSILRTLTRINPVLWLLGVCSVVTLGYALERVVALRRERVVPREFVNRFLERLSSGKLDRDRAAELCRAHDSSAARIFTLAVSAWGQPAIAIRQSLSLDAAGEIADLKRNVRVLNGMATLAPLLGLLGTVVGLIQSFDSLGGRVGPSRGEALAQGISLALVSTALGLGIAVVSVAVYYYLLNRIDVLVRDLEDNARKVIDLISSEALRPAPASAAAGRPAHAPADHPRHESRIH
jgi:biopolymer transport protein ExbB